jgi:hypothetical protein
MTDNGIIDYLSPDEELSILRQLVQEDHSIGRKIDRIARKGLADVDVKEIAHQVYFDLDALAVEDVWERAGDPNEYIEPGEAAWEMFAETLRPFMSEMKRHRDLAMLQEEKDTAWGYSTEYAYSAESPTLNTRTGQMMHRANSFSQSSIHGKNPPRIRPTLLR